MSVRKKYSDRDLKEHKISKYINIDGIDNNAQNSILGIGVSKIIIIFIFFVFIINVIWAGVNYADTGIRTEGDSITWFMIFFFGMLGVCFLYFSLYIFNKNTNLYVFGKKGRIDPLYARDSLNDEIFNQTKLNILNSSKYKSLYDGAAAEDAFNEK